MGWVMTDAEKPSLTITQDNQIEWNEATHRLLRYPVRVNVYHEDADGVFAIAGSGYQYQVMTSDEGAYLIECEAALEQMGVNNLDKDYTVVPNVFDEDDPDPAQAYIDGGVWAPLPD